MEGIPHTAGLVILVVLAVVIAVGKLLAARRSVEEDLQELDEETEGAAGTSPERTPAPVSSEHALNLQVEAEPAED
jgi:hypothetical protein